MRVVQGLMAVVLAGSALLQLNDPDPWRWTAIYLVAAAISVLAALDAAPKWRRPVALAVAVWALVWAVAVAFSSPRVPPLRDLFGDWAMYGAGIEERRETLGLLLLSCWLACVARPASRTGQSG